MIAVSTQPGPMFNFSDVEQSVLAGGAAGRLLLASLLGAIIGLEREYHHKASGIRTNLLICFGCALFTFLSAVLAGEGNPDKGRVASNIVQGIGFLGAGLILHNRSRISGLTSAATVFVVASIGMACGAGLYAPAILSTAIALISLESVGILETKFNLKLFPMLYEARGQDLTLLIAGVLRQMDRLKQHLVVIERDSIGEMQRISFTVTATLKTHRALQSELNQETAIGQILTFRDSEEE